MEILDSGQEHIPFRVQDIRKPNFKHYQNGINKQQRFGFINNRSANITENHCNLSFEVSYFTCNVTLTVAYKLTAQTNKSC